jgi:hypothetical protein
MGSEIEISHRGLLLATGRGGVPGSFCQWREEEICVFIYFGDNGI